MTSVEITLELPDEVAREAAAAGLLNSERIAEWLRTELDRRRHIAELRADIRKLRALTPELTPEEIAAEIKAAREDE